MAEKKKRSFKKIFQVIFFFLLIFSFQNCSQPFEVNEQMLNISSTAASSDACTIANGQGRMNSLSLCEVVTCDLGFHAENNACVSNVRNCSGTGVNNTQSWNGSSWGACVTSQCSADSHLENNSCQSNERTCSTTQGNGIQSWSNGAWGACSVPQPSSPGNSDGGAVVPEYDNRSCTVNGKVGTQGLNSGVWSACRTCDADAYTSFRGVCFDNPTFAKNYASFLPGCWSNGLLTCPVSVHSGFISVPSRHQIRPSESVTFNVFYMGSANVTLSANQVQVSGPGAVGCTKSVSGTGSATRTVTLSGCQGPGAVSISISAGSSTGISGGSLAAFGPSPDVIVMPTLPSVSYSLKTDGTYPGANGNQIPFEMHYPANFASLANIPIIVWIHGGGWTGGTAEIDRPLAQLFAELGFLVFNINYTLAPPSGVAFPGFSLPATPYSVGPNDVKAFINYLKTNVYLMNGDTSKISIAGSSAGAHLALHQATRPDNSTQFRCVISAAGPTLLTAYKDSANYPITRAILLNVFGDNVSVLNSNSPAFNVANFKGTSLGIFHQLQDNLVPISQALELVSAIKKIKPATPVTLNYANETNPNSWINPTINQITHIYSGEPSSFEALKYYVHTQCR